MTADDKLAQIANLHVPPNAAITWLRGPVCVECSHPWPCETVTLARTEPESGPDDQPVDTLPAWAQHAYRWLDFIINPGTAPEPWRKA